MCNSLIEFISHILDTKGCSHRLNNNKFIIIKSMVAVVFDLNKNDFLNSN